jgi:hypothetical protein
MKPYPVRQAEYEREKYKLQQLNLSPKEYEREIKKLIRRLKV